jgi:hypothetical protein
MKIGETFEVFDFPLAYRFALAYNCNELVRAACPKGYYTMRKSSSRLVAGVVVLGLFAFVGAITLSSFAPSSVSASTPQGSSEIRTDSKSPWQPTRDGSVTKP